ncbi:MAG: DUF2851 family protein [Bacteroidia bacterium]|nr:DUF2851 family protein [Bacteroidia bacterium]
MKFKNEADIQAYWSGHPFKDANLKSFCGKSVIVQHPGFLNTASGPDFFNACIRIGGVLWCGSVEIHAKSSQWFDHGHQYDPAYDNVVLHVVVDHDCEVRTCNGTIPATLILPSDTARRKRKLKRIPANFSAEEFAVRRLQRKVADLRLLPEAINGNTEALFYRLFFSAFGNHQNALPFENLAVVTPVTAIRRQRAVLSDVEALLYGQSGLLTPVVTDPYVNDLLLRYSSLQRKYNLIPMATVGWKQMGMRPVNFPCVRISQLASLLHRHHHLMTDLIYETSVEELRVMLQATAGSYWNTHFTFGSESVYAVKSTGPTFINSLLINAVAVFRWYYSELNVDTGLRNSVLEMLSSLPAEDNATVRKAGVTGSNALTTQAVLEFSKVNSY